MDWLTPSKTGPGRRITDLFVRVFTSTEYWMIMTAISERISPENRNRISMGKNLPILRVRSSDHGWGGRSKTLNTHYEQRTPSHGDFFENCLTKNHSVRIIYNKLNMEYRKRRIWRRSVNQKIRKQEISNQVIWKDRTDNQILWSRLEFIGIAW